MKRYLRAPWYPGEDEPEPLTPDEEAEELSLEEQDARADREYAPIVFDPHEGGRRSQAEQAWTEGYD